VSPLKEEGETQSRATKRNSLRREGNLPYLGILEKAHPSTQKGKKKASQGAGGNIVGKKKKKGRWYIRRGRKEKRKPSSL